MFNKQKVLDNLVSILEPMSMSYLSGVVRETTVKYVHYSTVYEAYADVWLIPTPHLVDNDGIYNRVPEFACLVDDIRVSWIEHKQLINKFSNLGVKELLIVDLCSECVELYQNGCSRLAVIQGGYLTAPEDIIRLRYNNVIKLRDIVTNAR